MNKFFKKSLAIIGVSILLTSGTALAVFEDTYTYDEMMSRYMLNGVSGYTAQTAYSLTCNSGDTIIEMSLYEYYDVGGGELEPTGQSETIFPIMVDDHYTFETANTYLSNSIVGLLGYGGLGTPILDCGNMVVSSISGGGGGEEGGEYAGMFSVATTTASSFVGVAKEVIADEGTGKIVAMFAGVIVAFYIIHNVIEFFPRNKKNKK